MAEKVDWSQRFDDPILMSDGSTIRTIGEAAHYATKLPKPISDTEPWQRAARDLAVASERAAYVFFARISFYRALYGERSPPIGQPRPTRVDRFKAQRAAAKKKGPDAVKYRASRERSWPEISRR